MKVSSSLPTRKPKTQDKPALRNARSEFASGEALESTEALGQFDSGQAILAIEPAKEVRRGMRALPGVAFDTTGHQAAVGAELAQRLLHDVIDAALPAADLAHNSDFLTPLTAPAIHWFKFANRFFFCLLLSAFCFLLSAFVRPSVNSIPLFSFTYAKPVRIDCQIFFVLVPKMDLQYQEIYVSISCGFSTPSSQDLTEPPYALYCVKETHSTGITPAKNINTIGTWSDRFLSETVNCKPSIPPRCESCSPRAAPKGASGASRRISLSTVNLQGVRGFCCLSSTANGER